MNPEDLLKQLAGLSGFELQIYDKPVEEERKKGKRGPRPKNNVKLTKKQRVALEAAQKESKKTETEEVDEEEDAQDELLDSQVFDYENYEARFPTVCEADYQFSKALEILEKEEEEETEAEGEAEGGVLENSESEEEEDSDEDITEESPEFLESLPKIAQMERWARRTGIATENPHGLRNKLIEEFFNRTLMQKVFEKSLQAAKDPHIDGKLKYNRAMITLKSCEEFFNAIRLHLYQIILETDVLVSAMDSIYSRARIQSPLPEISLDCRRLRDYKTDHPTAKLPEILNAFNANHQKPRFLNRNFISAEIIKEACRRLGADNFGGSAEFSNLFDLITEEELIEDEKEKEKEVVDGISDNKPQVKVPANLDYEKIQEAIKSALQAKLNKKP